MKANLILCLLIGSLFSAQAQSDQWTGIWQFSRKPYAGALNSIQLQLHIGKPEMGILYPAVLTLKYGEFTGIYEMLLARKNEYQLGISRAKYPLKQSPYKLGIWMWYLNGTLDMNNKKISVNRMFIDKSDFWMRGLYDDDEIYVHSKTFLRDFLYRDSITLSKTGTGPLPDSSVKRILDPAIKKVYFGIYDPIVSKQAVIPMKVEDDERYDKDTVTLLHNGRALFSKEQITDRNRRMDIKLDSGRNLFIFFADNYGNIQPNTGLLHATIDGKEYGFGFANRSNAYATFLVADILYKPAQHSVTRTAPPVSPGTIEPAPVPVPAAPPVAKISGKDTVTKRLTSSIATFKVDTADVVLELRDKEIQDGDSISLRFNGEWILKGFAVKKSVQSVNIHLKRGENRLLFVADNLGSIPPNTAELRIRYKRETKVLSLSTDLAKNNEIIIDFEP